MRYSLILVVACSPLAALTGWSLWQAITAQSTPAADADKSDTGDIAKRASGATERVKEKSDLVKTLPEIDLLEAGGQELPDAVDDKMKTAWQASTLARRLAAQYAKAGPISFSEASTTARRRQAETSLARLREFISNERPNYVGKLHGAEEFFALLDRRARQIEEEIGSYRRQDQMAEAEAAAKNDLDQGRYDACLKRLDSDPLTQAADPDQADRLQLLRKRAEYRRAWEEIDRQGTSTADSDLYNAMQSFLRKYPDPPTPAERDLQVQLERRRDRLRSEISVHVLDQAHDLDALLAEAVQIVANKQIEEPVKRHARHQATDWLYAHLPKIEAPSSLLGEQEALTKSGQRKIGMFFLPPGAEQYRFWIDRRNRSERPRGDEQIPRGALEQPPTKPQYVAWAEQYKDRVSALVHESASRADWQQFADDCDTWQQQLVAYREQWGIDDEPDRSCREWSFHEAATLARNVVRHWSQYEEVVGREE